MLLVRLKTSFGCIVLSEELLDDKAAKTVFLVN